MTNTCPLPIDWLDYVDAGRQDPELTEHLDRCPSCRSLVDALGSTKEPTKPRMAAYERALWHEQARSEVKPGDIWITSPTYHSQEWSYEGIDRLFVVILNAATRMAGPDWFEVAPIWMDVEMADDSSLLFEDEDTTLGGQWRLLSGNHGIAHQAQLGGWVGELTISGRTHLDSFFNGTISLDRIGTKILDPSDPRLVTAAWIGAAMEAINGASLAIGEEAVDVEVSGDLQHRSGAVIHIRARLMLVPASSRANDITAMAAASRSGRQDVVLEAADEGHRLEGVLKWDRHYDAIVLTVRGGKGWTGLVRALFVAPDGRQLESPWFEPTPDRAVVLPHSGGMFPNTLRDAWVEG